MAKFSSFMEIGVSLNGSTIWDVLKCKIYLNVKRTHTEGHFGLEQLYWPQASMLGTGKYAFYLILNLTMKNSTHLCAFAVFLTLKAAVTTAADYILIFILSRIRPNYHTYPYKCTVKQFHSLQITARVLFVFFIKVHVVGTHLNCIDLLMQFKWVPATYAFIKKVRRRKHCINTTRYVICLSCF